MDFAWEELWYKSKQWLGDGLGMSNDLMHVNFGLCVFLFFAVLFRNFRFGVFVAWLIVAAVQAANEFFDAKVWINWTGSVNWPELVKDFVWTLLWPTVLLIIWRRPKPLGRDI